ncbi:MAG: hypothetical protein ACR2QW_05520 [bacterium]
MNRAERRYHTQRIKQNRKHYWGKKLTSRELGIAARTPHPCSCFMCANYRKLEGDTLQERRAMYYEAEF